MTRLHPRCGTSFLLVVIMHQHPAAAAFIRVANTLAPDGLLQLLLLPVVVAVAL